MAMITIRNLDEDTKRNLQVMAAMHGRSMEAEARDILRYHLRDIPRLMPESYPPPAPDRASHLTTDHGSVSEDDLPHAARAPRGMDPREAILLVNRELEKLGAQELMLPEDLPLG